MVCPALYGAVWGRLDYRGHDTLVIFLAGMRLQAA